MAIFELEQKTIVTSSAHYISQNCYYWAQLIVGSTNVDVNSLLKLICLGCLKALCYAIRADCLLIEATRTHMANEQWAWRMVDKFTCTFKSAH